ncbi:MAG: hypothetical protein QM541_16275, partial [Flavobacterium sp.]|nr:hypothetical protein [Flavobacterium sp.]
MNTFTKWLLIASLTLFFGLTVKAQSWATIGGTKEFAPPSESAISTNSMVRDASGNLYVAYRDGGQGDKLTVKKWTASTNTWSVLGTAGISVGAAQYISMGIDASAHLYVAYRDEGIPAGAGLVGSRLAVKKWDGTAWSNPGGAASISTGGSYYSSTVIDASGNVYVAYQDGYKLSVQKWNGTTWSYVGGVAGISTFQAQYISTAIDASGNVYVAYTDQGGSDEYKLSVQKWNGTAWSYVGGTAGISTGWGFYSSIAIDAGANVYVGYWDGDKAGKLTVQKYNGTAWSVVGGTTGISVDEINYTSTVIDASGNVYVAYQDKGVGYKTIVQKWDTTAHTWTHVGGTAGITAGRAAFNSMVIDASANLYVAYQDGSIDNKLTVQKYTASGGGSWGKVGSAGIAAGGTTYNSTVKDASGNLYVAYTDAANGDKLAVKKWTASSNTWSEVGSGISAGAATYNSIVVDASGNLYVAYTDDANSKKLTVKKWTASSNTWASVGSTAFTSTEAAYISMVIDAYGNNLYVAYKESVNSKLVIQKWDGTTWVPVGAAAGISNSLVFHISMVIDASSNLYVAYQDLTASLAPRLFVQKYDSLAGSWGYVATTVATGISAGGALYNSMVRDASGNLYVAYKDENKSGKLTVQKYNGTSWSVLGSTGISAGTATYNSIGIDGTGNVYVAYSDGSKSDKLTVQKWDGTSWSVVGGTTGISAGGTTYNSMVVDASGILYVVYSSTQLFAQAYGSVVLPVTIADITAQLQANKTVAVNWTSATELN